MWICVTAKCMWFVKSEVLRAVLLKMQVFWNAAPCRWVSSSRLFDGSYCLHLDYQGQTCTNPDAGLPGRLNFVWWRLIILGPQSGTCFVSLSWHLEFWCGSSICGRLCTAGQAYRLFILHRTYCTWNKPGPIKRLSYWFVTTGHPEDFYSGRVLSVALQSAGPGFKSWGNFLVICSRKCGILISLGVFFFGGGGVEGGRGEW
jgi:hypothetical protein